MLSECLDRLGIPEGASVSIEEAVALYRALAAARPEALNSDLVAALSKFLRLSKQSRSTDGRVGC